MRRIGDGEVAETAEMLSKSASQLKKSLDADLKKSRRLTRRRAPRSSRKRTTG